MRRRVTFSRNFLEAAVRRNAKELLVLTGERPQVNVCGERYKSVKGIVGPADEEAWRPMIQRSTDGIDVLQPQVDVSGCGGISVGRHSRIIEPERGLSGPDRILQPDLAAERNGSVDRRVGLQ